MGLDRVAQRAIGVDFVVVPPAVLPPRQVAGAFEIRHDPLHHPLRNPDLGGHIPQTDHWRCRFEPARGDTAVTHAQIAALLQRADHAGLDCIKTENLYTFADLVTELQTSSCDNATRIVN